MAVFDEPMPKWLEAEMAAGARLRERENIMTNVVDISERLPHRPVYVSCMDCAKDWVAVVPPMTQFPLECPACHAKAGEEVRTGDLEWFKRYMAGGDRDKRTMVLLNAKRMGL